MDRLPLLFSAGIYFTVMKNPLTLNLTVSVSLRCTKILRAAGIIKLSVISDGSMASGTDDGTAASMLLSCACEFTLQGFTLASLPSSDIDLVVFGGEFHPLRRDQPFGKFNRIRDRNPRIHSCVIMQVVRNGQHIIKTSRRRNGKLTVN